MLEKNRGQAKEMARSTKQSESVSGNVANEIRFAWG